MDRIISIFGDLAFTISILKMPHAPWEIRWCNKPPMYTCTTKHIKSKPIYGKYIVPSKWVATRASFLRLCDVHVHRCEMISDCPWPITCYIVLQYCPTRLACSL